MMIHGFGPIAAKDACVLVLGTIPGLRSLALGQYYGHPHNAFWYIMERLLGSDAQPDYRGRTQMLQSAGVALWDVLRRAERELSVDSAIVAGSEVVNDFQAFFAQHTGIRTLFFNGARAEALFRRLVLPGLPDIRHLPMRRLPSTSPANARLGKNEKLAAWRAVSKTLECLGSRESLCGRTPLPPSKPTSSKPFLPPLSTISAV